MMMKKANTLFEPSVRPKDFQELELSKQQLRVWTDLTGFQPEGRQEGKWRRFSPADVFRLAVMRELKNRTGLAISDHPTLVDTLGNDSVFLSILAIWTAGGLPCLVTDLHERHTVDDLRAVDVASALASDDLCCVMKLTSALQVMRRAVVRGGTEEQRLLCLNLEIDREERDSGAQQGPQPQPAPRKRSNKGRVIELGSPNQDSAGEDGK